LIQLADGFLYGTTEQGGAFGQGTVFKIMPDGTNFGVIKSLQCTATNGCNPFAGLIQLGDGFLYGTTNAGGAANGGTVFKIMPDGTGFSVIKSFQCGGVPNGCSPQAGLIQLADGFLYGTTSSTTATGGVLNQGTVFKVLPDGSNFTLIHAFVLDGNNGFNPRASLRLVDNGYLYGTTSAGGLFGAGTIFRIPAPDATAPDTTIILAPPPVTNATDATFTFTSTEADITFECKFDADAFVLCSSPETYTSLTEGAHSFQVRARDLANNADPSPAMHSWSVDITPPDTLINSGPENPTTSTNATFEFTSNDAGSTFECSLDDAAFAPCAGPVNYTGLAVGNHNFRVRAIDAAGNFDTTPESHSWTINALDTTPPDTTIISTPPALTNSTSATFTFTVSQANSTFECNLDSAGFTGCGSPATYNGLGGGSHNFRVRATDPAGNTDSTPASFNWTIQ
jgi:uncharacterized repeat protein (TIGR03803 family)